MTRGGRTEITDGQLEILDALLAVAKTRIARRRLNRIKRQALGRAGGFKLSTYYSSLWSAR